MRRVSSDAQCATGHADLRLYQGIPTVTSTSADTDTMPARDRDRRQVARSSEGMAVVDANVQRFDVAGATTSGVYTHTPGTAWNGLGGATVGGVALSSF